MVGNVNELCIAYEKCGYISKNRRKNSHGQYHSKRELLETTSKHSMEWERDVCVCTLVFPHMI